MWSGTQSYVAPGNSNICVLQQRVPLVSSLSEKIYKFEAKKAEEIEKFIYDREPTYKSLPDHSPTARLLYY